MNTIAGGVCAPRGFRAAGVVAHIKNLQTTKKDCALIVSDAPATVAGVFTTNKVKAAPVLWTQGVCVRETARALFANSGNANACTGTQGLSDAQATAEMVAGALGVPITEVCVCSTGVIGLPLPMDRIANGVSDCLTALSDTGGADAAQAIMTTDKVAKETAVELPLDCGTVRIGAIAKGSGMIAPNMATMLCFITTDAALRAADLRVLLSECARQSFNCVCVDNDSSTNDTLLCLANGQSGVPLLEPGTANYAAFARAFHKICVFMAQALVRDGEGATKFIEILVEGANSDREAQLAAKAVAQSQLCKTAFFGQDPNWGRIACAAGYSGADFSPERLSISIEGLEVVRDGTPTAFEEAQAAELMKRHDLHVRVSLGAGPGRAVYWTSDLSHDYVSINADYRS
jgi:glutamate N-acetyltransferase/amino-acid N-acetyltransferase